MDPLLDSSNITVREWNAIGTVIAENHDRYDGFVVLHGTDTMAYTASALSFTLRNNSKPVILTGSQIPLCEIRNDARDNLITAMLVAANDWVHEVCLYFGGKLLRFAEEKVFAEYDEAFLDSSLPAKQIYLKKGYIPQDYHIIDAFGDHLCFDSMLKKKEDLESGLL